MGSTFSLIVKKPFKSFNIESRAQKLIDPNVKPKVAPRHPSTEEISKQNEKLDPFIKSELYNKNEKLSLMLKNMVVEIPKIPEAGKEKSKLPENRSKVEDFEYGYMEPVSVRPGRCTIKQALEFLGFRQTQPEKFHSDLIAKKYNLNEDDVKNVMNYFSIFQVHLPNRLQDTSIRERFATGLPDLMRKALPSSPTKIYNEKDILEKPP